ncbi:MAG: hypothetical protein Q8R12_04595 [bacterium]|nr:hypothetical protein [bacterium]
MLQGIPILETRVFRALEYFYKKTLRAEHLRKERTILLVYYFLGMLMVFVSRERFFLASFCILLILVWQLKKNFHGQLERRISGGKRYFLRVLLDQSEAETLKALLNRIEELDESNLIEAALGLEDVREARLNHPRLGAWRFLADIEEYLKRCRRAIYDKNLKPRF